MHLSTSAQIIIVRLEKALLVPQLSTRDAVSIGVAVVLKDLTYWKLTLLELLGNGRLWEGYIFLAWVTVGRPLTQHSELGLVCSLWILCFGFLGLFTLLFACGICRVSVVIFILFVFGGNCFSLGGWFLLRSLLLCSLFL
jgi:hypothetical protein